MPPQLSLLNTDLIPFADLGTEVIDINGGFHLIRGGIPHTISVSGQGYGLEKPSSQETFYPSAGALLASDFFGDLQRLARHQDILLAPHSIKGTPVPIGSTLHPVRGQAAEFEEHQLCWQALHEWLKRQAQTRPAGGTDILLIDGPAGVGKTTVIQELSYLRAKSYDGTFPLIIQIGSRGRVLQNIADLIAFALQDTRSNLTVDQLLVLIRHAKIILAIDGFDELSDPNGFQTAWSGLNRLFEEARGEATFLLAGRETFISTDTILRQLSSFRKYEDRLAKLTLSDPDAEDARSWILRKDGWDTELLKSPFVEPIFEKGSYALRPFFLNVIAREPAALRDHAPTAPDLLTFLVDTMVQREAEKFLVNLDPQSSTDAKRAYLEYVYRFLEEVARDLAENQVDAIPDTALDLISRIAADGIIPDDQIPAVCQRARTVVFLANDVQVGHIRFAHDQIQHHFLAREALRSIADGQLPRYIRRGVFGRDSQEVFSNVARASPELARQFLTKVRLKLREPSTDRTNANLAVLGISVACGAIIDDADLLISGIEINELYFPFTPPCGIYITSGIISVLYASKANIKNIVLGRDLIIVTLEADRDSVFPSEIPRPQILVFEGETITLPQRISAILSGPDTEDRGGTLSWPGETADLLDRIDRYRSFWLKLDPDNTDPLGRRIVSHPEWPKVYGALQKLNLVVVRNLPSSGARSDFVHFRTGISLMGNEELHKLLFHDE